VPTVAVNEEFLAKIWNGTLEALTEGSKSVLIWGFTPECISLVSRMKDHGADALISGIVDPRKVVQGHRVADLRVSSPELIPSLEMDTLVIAVDQDKELALTEFSRIDNRTPRVIMAGTRHLEFNDPLFHEVLSSCMVSSRAAGYRHMLAHIYQSIVYIANRGLKGSFVEFGVYKAGTTVFLAKTLQKLNINSKIYAFDTFDGFPPRKSLLDLYSDGHDEFSDFASVSAYCSGYPIELIRGDICETYRQLDGVPLVFSFFDTDNYSPTKWSLEMCYEQTVPGGILSFDHFYCDERWLYTLGERIAVTEVLKGKNVFNLHGTGIFIKL
jgi:hypothetical protein